MSLSLLGAASCEQVQRPYSTDDGEHLFSSATADAGQLDRGRPGVTPVGSAPNQPGVVVVGSSDRHGDSGGPLSPSEADASLVVPSPTSVAEPWPVTGPADGQVDVPDAAMGDPSPPSDAGATDSGSVRHDAGDAAVGSTEWCCGAPCEGTELEANSCTPLPCSGAECLPGAGEPCTDEGVCGEGRCQLGENGAGICCTESCDAACLSCASSGTSCVPKSDDLACGSIACPTDTACRNYQDGVVTSKRCVAGACGSPEQLCSFTIRGEGLECSPTHTCDPFGNCSVPKLGQGAACGADDECTTGHCVDGVCCESACSGPCMQCRTGTGLCDVVPVDDMQCPDVACGAKTTECATSLGDITSNRCHGLGTCKTEQQCPVSQKPKGTPCSGYPSTCNGQGACVFPDVQCGASSCSIEGEGSCCVSSASVNVTTPVCQSIYATCLNQMSDWVVRCDEQSDCRQGEQICCARSTTSGSTLACLPPQECNVGSVETEVTTRELCESPVMAKRACSRGVACSTTSSTLPGFTFCRLPTP